MVSNLNIELMRKNEKMLEMLDEIEEVKIEVYARDKSIELQQKQIEDLLEELRECKAVDNDIKILVSKNIALGEENQRMRKDIDEKFVSQHEKQFEQLDLAMEKKSLLDKIQDLSKSLEQERTENNKYKSSNQAEKDKYSKAMAAANLQIETKTRELEKLQKECDSQK